MTNSIEYKDKELNISVEDWQSYLGSLSAIYSIYLGHAVVLSPSDFKYEKKSDYIPFRLLDEMLVPYFELEFVPSSVEMCEDIGLSCKETRGYDYVMRTMVGTLVIYKNVTNNGLTPQIGLFDQYKIPVIQGPNKNTADKAVSNFPKIFWNSVMNYQAVKVSMGPKVYELISVESSPMMSSMPIAFYFPKESDVIEKLINDTAKILEQSPVIHIANVNPKVLKVSLKLFKHQYTCLDAIGNITKQDSAVHADEEDKVNEVALDSVSSEEVLEHFIDPLGLNFQSKNSSDLHSYASVVLPDDISSLLVKRLPFKLKDVSKNQFIDIILDIKGIPTTAKFIDNEIRAILNEDYDISSMNQTTKNHVISKCSVYLTPSQDNSQLETSGESFQFEDGI